MTVNTCLLKTVVCVKVLTVLPC